MPAFARIPLTAETRPRPLGAATAPAFRGSRTDTAQSGSTSEGAPSGTINLVVATPCFGGQLSVTYAASLFKLQTLLRAYGDFNLKLIFKDGDALITRARASLISQFLDDPSATHLLFIDADIGFEPEQVIRLLQCGAEMCAAVFTRSSGSTGTRSKRQSTARGSIPRRRHYNMYLRLRTRTP